jgi:hypothetical protein
MGIVKCVDPPPSLSLSHQGKEEAPRGIETRKGFAGLLDIFECK